MLDHEGGELAVQLVEQQQVAVPHLVKHCYSVSLTVIGFAHGVDGADIGNVAPVTDVDSIQVVADVLNQASVTDGHVAQRGIIDATVLDKALSNLDSAFAAAQTCPTIELHAMAALGVKVISYLYLVPILSPTVVSFQGIDLLVCKVSVFFHELDIF